MSHYRVDGERSNSYETWKKMGSPEEPTRAQYAELEKAAMLKTIAAPARHGVNQGRLEFSFPLPRQAVSLIKIDY